MTFEPLTQMSKFNVQFKGDRKSEWQSLEALATIAYHDKDLQRSQDYYKLALTILAKSQDAGDTTVQDRILGKLTSVIQLQSNKPAQPVDVTRQVNIKSFFFEKMFLIFC